MGGSTGSVPYAVSGPVSKPSAPCGLRSNRIGMCFWHSALVSGRGGDSQRLWAVAFTSLAQDGLSHWSGI